MKKSSTYTLGIALGLVSLGLLGTAAGWKIDHAHLKKELRRAANPSQQQHQDEALAQLNQQHETDAATIQQLRGALVQQTSQAGDLSAQLKTTNDKLANTQHDYLFLQSHLNDLRARSDQNSAEEGRYYQLYTVWKETGFAQREYIKGLYVDDSTLRHAANKPAYAPMNSADPEAALTMPPPAAVQSTAAK